MKDSQDAKTSPGAASDRVDGLGKLRTWWHTLLTQVFKHLLSTAYAVKGEQQVGQMPLRVDIQLIRRDDGFLTELVQRELSVLIPLLNRVTLIEFKGPTDDVKRGDLAKVMGSTLLWHGQYSELIPQNELSLIILAPCRTEAQRLEMECLNLQLTEREPGLHQVAGAIFPTWFVETNVMAELMQPILSLFSRVFLKEHRRIISELWSRGHTEVLAFVLQQVQQFRTLGEGFAMQHAETKQMRILEDELLMNLPEATPAEKRLQGLSPQDRVRGLSPEDRVQGLSPEDRVQGLSPSERLCDLSVDEFFAGLTQEQAERFKQLLQRKSKE